MSWIWRAFQQFSGTGKITLKKRFQNMKIKENYIACASSASKDKIDVFFDIIHLIDETIEKDKLSPKDVESSEQLKSFITSHCRAILYTFQIINCLSEDCFISSTLQPIWLEKDTFDSIGFLPDPMRNISKEHYQHFKDIFKKEIMERDWPSLRFSLEVTETDKSNKSLLVAAKVCATIICSLFSKLRCVYSNSKFTKTQSLKLKRHQKENTCSCGESLFAPNDNYYHSIITRQQLNCSLPMETTYYGSVTVTFKLICFHCGGTSGCELLNNDFTRGLKRNHAKVRPICRICRVAGKEPSTWGVNNLNKKQKL